MTKTGSRSRNKALITAAIAIVSFFACFIFAPIGSFVPWVFGGIAAYFSFLSVYLLVDKPGRRFTTTRSSPRQEEMRTYVTFHLRILGTAFLVAILIVIAFLMFV
jgi:hypothetical protein